MLTECIAAYENEATQGLRVMNGFSSIGNSSFVNRKLLLFLSDHQAIKTKFLYITCHCNVLHQTGPLGTDFIDGYIKQWIL